MRSNVFLKGRSMKKYLTGILSLIFCITVFSIRTNACVPGYYGQGEECLPCPAGKYSTSGDYCFSCEEGTYAVGTGNPSCQVCPRDTASCEPDGTISCKAGYKYNPTDRKCEACEPGTYAAGTGNTICLPCPAGTYTTATASKKCTACEAGTYMPDSGSTFCTPLPENASANKNEGANAFSCNTGFYQDGNECRPCSDDCLSCSSATSCSVCKEGYVKQEDHCLLYPDNCEKAVLRPCPCHGPVCKDICRSYVPTTTICTACKDGYILRDKGCLKDTVAGCAPELKEDLENGVFCKIPSDRTPPAPKAQKTKETDDARQSGWKCAENYYQLNGQCSLCPPHALCDGSDFFCDNSHYKGMMTTCECKEGDNDCRRNFVPRLACLDCPANAECEKNVFTCNFGYYKTGDKCNDVCSGTICKETYAKIARGDRCYCE